MAVAVVVPGISKWILAAVLAGVASAISGLVTRVADKVMARGRDAVLVSSSSAPIIVAASSDASARGHIGTPPMDLAELQDSPNWVDLWDTAVYLTVEANVERAVVLRKMEIQVESRDTPPEIVCIERKPSPAPMDPRTFDVHFGRVDLDNAAPELDPIGRGNKFPYKVSHLDPEYFELHTSLSSPGDITWRIRVHWLCNGQVGITIADLKGQPFRLVRPHDPL
ncbi:hypothetical protein [Streptomyces xiamenensis]|uniref:hypothetical protein n=1 Tax=Streptomyces xiamenensis TaxID=408015 RepID=UPI0011D201A1|nr:hypothetical protein [Streptomyces xiamenensis]